MFPNWIIFCVNLWHLLTLTHVAVAGAQLAPFSRSFLTSKCPLLQGASCSGQCPGYTDSTLGPRITKKTPSPDPEAGPGSGEVAMLQQPPPRPESPAQHQTAGYRGNAARKNIFGFIGFILMNLYRFTEV